MIRSVSHPLLLAVCGLFIATAHLTAQSPADEARLKAACQTAMAHMAGWQGHWAGTGWSRGPEGRGEFLIDEEIRFDLNGTVLVVRGRGKADADASELQHDALGVLYCNPAAESYQMHSHLASGRNTRATGEWLADGRFRWGFEIPGGMAVRYTVTLEGDAWTASGEITRDGETWNLFMSMNLTRVVP